jgi:hypothetical protein
MPLADGFVTLQKLRVTLRRQLLALLLETHTLRFQLPFLGEVSLHMLLVSPFGLFLLFTRLFHCSLCGFHSVHSSSRAVRLAAAVA